MLTNGKSEISTCAITPLTTGLNFQLLGFSRLQLTHLRSDIVDH